ncbi:MAG: hypothetical protein R3C68_16765 [Myxococcota bacterium]
MSSTKYLRISMHEVQQMKADAQNLERRRIFALRLQPYDSIGERLLATCRLSDEMKRLLPKQSARRRLTITHDCRL